jgi:hypothetical protein
VLSDFHYEKVGFYKKLLPKSIPLVVFWLLGGQKPKPKVKPNTPLFYLGAAEVCLLINSSRTLNP